MKAKIKKIYESGPPEFWILMLALVGIATVTTALMIGAGRVESDPYLWWEYILYGSGFVFFIAFVCGLTFLGILGAQIELSFMESIGRAVDKLSKEKEVIKKESEMDNKN